MSLIGVRHVGLTISDLQTSVEWYRTVLGFTELFREAAPDRSVAVLGCGETVLGLVQFGGDGGEFSPRQIGLDHLCFRVRDAEELTTWARRLDQHGVEHSGVQQMTSGPILNFTDPDGIALAFAPSSSAASEGQEAAGHRVVNPWTWQDRAGFVQAHEVTGAARTLYCAGVVGVDAEGRPAHAGDVGRQALLALDNLETILTAAGYSLGDVVRLNTYTTDVDRYAAARTAVQERLDAAGCRYAATLLGVARLARPELLVELEATAARPVGS